MSVLEKLTEGIVNRSLAKDGQALLNKWERTGLLEGLGNDRDKNSMASLLENQAKELLREASAMSQGDVEGFAAVAFPIVRRVFGGLVANDLVSVQPMSLPSGLIFFLDFTHTDARGAQGALGDRDAMIEPGDSVYGGGVVGSEIQGGVGTLTGTGYYDLQSGYASPTGSLLVSSGDIVVHAAQLGTAKQVSALNEAEKKAIRFDPDILADTSAYVGKVTVTLTQSEMDQINLNALHLCTLENVDFTHWDDADGDKVNIVRRLTEKTGDLTLDFTWTSSAAATNSELVDADLNLVFGASDQFAPGNGLGSVKGTDSWGLEGRADSPSSGLSTTVNAAIPEIDIKVDSIAVTAVTKKLKAKWTPELGQDLNAYHNLDAEVELTGILSEQIALEIDQEILNDLVKGATAGTLYWSRRPGQFLDPEAGTSITSSTAPPDFTGTVSEWYETLVETINDVSARIHRKTLRGGANFVVCSPEVANILEFTSGFRAKVSHDEDKGEIGAVNVGSLSKKFDIFVDPYFLRNVLLVGRKGNSFLESGFVYAPYVPLQVTPTIFGDEDFLPRKGVMTRYAKKMVRPDMYGLVVVRDLIG